MFLEEAQRIGNELLDKAQKDDNGFYWTATHSLAGSNTISVSLNESTYNGTSGIIILLLELYNVTGDEKYRIGAEKGITWVLNYLDNTTEKNYAFFTGTMSVAFTLIRANQILKDSTYIEYALSLAKEAKSFIKHDIAELINGISGTLLVLLHLHAYTKEEWILEDIRIFTDELISRIQIDKKGIYWDRNQTMIRPLCGFSHGVSGIGYVFLQLSYYFQNESFFWIAEQAFEYENQFYNNEQKNWTDLRKAIYQLDDEKKFLKAFHDNNLTFFENGGYMSAWCHGSPGIGLSRLHAFELTQKKTFENDYQNALSHVLFKDNSNNSASLCHGVFGDIELLIETYILNNDIFSLEQAREKGASVIKHKNKIGYYISGVPHGLQDSSLFLGDAGVAYNLLRLHNPHQTPSILSPKLSSFVDNNLFWANFLDIFKQIISKRFYRTLLITENCFPNEVNTFFNVKIASNSFINDWVNFIKNEILTKDYEYINRVQEVFELELFKMTIDWDIKSYAYLHMKNNLIIQKNKQSVVLSKDDFETLYIIIRDNIHIKENKWDWTNKTPNELLANLTMIDENHMFFLLPTPWGIQENTINNPLLKIILSVFTTNKQIKYGVSEVLEYMDFDNKSNKEDIDYASVIILSQIKQALLGGLLVAH